MEKKIIGRKEKISLPKLGLKLVWAKIDTGAYTSSIHAEQIREEEYKGKKVLEGTLQDIIKKYSAENSGDIHIVFKDEEAAKKIFDLFGETKILRMEGNKLYLVSFSGQYSANVLTNFLNKIKGYEKDIVDISIHKPNLEEIMLQLIKSD